MIAFVVRVHDAADGLAGVVEFPGATRTPFRTGDDLITLMETWLRDMGDEADRPQTTGGA